MARCGSLLGIWVWMAMMRNRSTEQRYHHLPSAVVPPSHFGSPTAGTGRSSQNTFRSWVAQEYPWTRRWTFGESWLGLDEDSDIPNVKDTRGKTWTDAATESKLGEYKRRSQEAWAFYMQRPRELGAVKWPATERSGVQSADVNKLPFDAAINVGQKSKWFLHGGNANMLLDLNLRALAS